MCASCAAMPILLASATAGATLSLLTLLPSLKLCEPGQCTWDSPCITVQVTSLRELHQQAQKYNSQLQEYNTKLQQDVALSNDSLQKLQVHLSPPQAACFQGHTIAASPRKSSQLLGCRLTPDGICNAWLASLQALLSHVDVHAELLRQATCCCSRMPALA